MTARVAVERALPAPAPWPRLAFCEQCWGVPDALGSRTWHPTAVFDYLSDAYGPLQEFPAPIKPVVGSGKDEPFLMSFRSTTVFLGIVLGGACFAALLGIVLCQEGAEDCIRCKSRADYKDFSESE